MERTCHACGETYQAIRETARYCSERCKKRGQRGQGQVSSLPAKPVADASRPPLILTFERELTEADRLDTPLGQTVMELATRMAERRDSGSALASLAKELRATLAEALRGVGAPASVVSSHRDELAARRRGA